MNIRSSPLDRSGRRDGFIALVVLRIGLALAAILAVANVASGATLYVRTSGNDLANGLTPATAVRTISRAVALAGPGDTIYVGGGTYPEAVLITKSGTSSAYITLAADSTGSQTGDAGDVIIDGAGSRDYGLKLLKCSYVRVRGFGVTRARKFGIGIGNGFRLVIESCRVYRNAKKGIDLIGQQCLVSDCAVYANSGIGIRCDGRETGSTLSRCLVYDNAKGGIRAKGATDLDEDDDDDDGDPDLPCTVLIVNCMVYGNGKYGINPGGSRSHVTLTNNTVAANAREGVYVYKSTACLRNNIVAFNGREGIRKAGSKPLTSDYNLLWGNGAGSYSGLSAGAHDVLADPLFQDLIARDLHLTSASPAVDAGTDEGAPAVDFEGQSRPVGKAGVDMGADEYGSRVLRVLVWQEVER